VLRLWMVSSSITWLHRCVGRRCWQRLHWVVWLAIRPMWCARRATSAAVRPLRCCAIAATGNHTRCLVPALPGVPDGDWVCPGCAPAPAPPAPSLPAAAPSRRPHWDAAYDDVTCQVCAGQHGAASMLLCTCGALACAGSARPLGTDPLLPIRAGPLLRGAGLPGRPGFGSWRVKTSGKAKVQLCRTGVAALGLVVFATRLEVDGFPQVYHTTCTVQCNCYSHYWF
jgi:hypothetical protein